MGTDGQCRPAEQVPHEGSNGAFQGLRTLFRQPSPGDGANIEDSGVGTDPEFAYCITERLDWILQDDATNGNAHMESASGFLGNTSYFTNPDVSAFIQASVTAMASNEDSTKEFADFAAVLTGGALGSFCQPGSSDLANASNVTESVLA